LRAESTAGSLSSADLNNGALATPYRTVVYIPEKQQEGSVIIVIDRALRDGGTSYHYLPPADLANQLKLLSREQRWEEMPAYISDDVLNTYATVGTFDEIGEKINERYGRVVTNVEFSIPIRNQADRKTLEHWSETMKSAQALAASHRTCRPRG